MKFLINSSYRKQSADWRGLFPMLYPKRSLWKGLNVRQLRSSTMLRWKGDVIAAAKDKERKSPKSFSNVTVDLTSEKLFTLMSQTSKTESNEQQIPHLIEKKTKF